MKTNLSRTTLALLTLAIASGCGLENSIVGGRCRPGMELSGDTCVDTGGMTQVAPTDPPAPPPSALSMTVTPPVNARVPARRPPLPTELGPQPVTPIEPPPELVCAPPLVACHGECISVDSDAANCGACGKICASNICIAGECQGTTPGDVVLIGHDYANANLASAQTKVLVNALTIATTDPIRVLSFEDGASAPAVAQMRYLASASIKNRQVRFTRAASAASLTDPTLAAAYDIVIINDASAVDPVVTGASWSGALGTFTMKGGVVVALDRGTSAMPELLTNAGLLAVAAHTTLAAGTHLIVASASDVIGSQVLSPYAAFGAPVSYQGLAASTPDLDWVVRVRQPDGSGGDAVVVHRVVR